MKNKGFAHILVLILVILGIGVLGYFSWQKGLIKTVRNDTALPAPTVSTKDWKVYKEEKFAGFEFSYPDNWFFESDPVTSYSKLSTSPMDKFVYGKLPTGNAVLIIDIGYRNKEITIEDWCHFHPNFKSVKEFSTTYPEINGINALRIKYAWEDKNIEGEHICLPLNNINQNSETVIDMDFYYYKNDPRKDYYLQTFDQILSTFKFNDTNITNQTPTDSNIEWVTFRNSEYGIEFSYPKGLTATQVHSKYINLIGNNPTSDGFIVMPMLIFDNSNNLSPIDFYLDQLGAGASLEELKKHLHIQTVSIGSNSAIRIVQDKAYFSQQSTPFTTYLIPVKKNSILNIKTQEFTGAFDGSKTSLSSPISNASTYKKILSTFKFTK